MSDSSIKPATFRLPADALPTELCRRSLSLHSSGSVGIFTSDICSQMLATDVSQLDLGLSFAVLQTKSNENRPSAPGNCSIRHLIGKYMCNIFTNQMA